MNHTRVEFPGGSESRNTEGFLVEPPDRGSANNPAVVVIHAIWGLVEFIKDVTTRFAKEGYVSLAPDLFGGQTASNLEEGIKIKSGFSEEKFLGDLRGAVAYLKRQENVNPKRIGSVGFCMGGTLSLLHACYEDVAACVIFYGWNPTPLELLKNVSCPILGNYGGADPRITHKDINVLKETLTKYGKKYDIKVYPGAPHAFFNETLPSYRADVAKDAWMRTIDYLSKNLKEGLI